MPDFDNLQKTLLCQGEPARVPLFEGSIHDDIKSRFLSKAVGTLETEVEFYAKAGYDYVPLTIGRRQTIRGEASGIMGAKQLESNVLKPVQAQYNPFQEAANTRLWAEEGNGLIQDEASFDNFPWPDPDGYDYASVERLMRLMPDGMKPIINVGYVFMASWMLMGMERFFIGIAEQDDLVRRIVDRVGNTQYQVVRNLLDIDGLGVVEDDAGDIRADGA